MSGNEKSTENSEGEKQTKDKNEKETQPNPTETQTVVHEWQMNEPIDVDAHEDNEANSFSNVLPVPTIMKIESLAPSHHNSRITSTAGHRPAQKIMTILEDGGGAPSIPVQIEPQKLKSLKKRTKHLTHACKSLGIDTKKGLDKVKEEIRLRIAKANPHPDLEDPRASSCRTIHIKNLPKWHQAYHVQSLIWLTSDFNIEGTNYYLDMYKDEQNKTTGECLIRFVENKDCIQVFKDLQGNFKTNRGDVVEINLDLGHKISRMRSLNDVNTNEKLKNFFETFARHKETLRKTENCTDIMESDDDDVELVETLPIKTEVIDDSNESDNDVEQSNTETKSNTESESNIEINEETNKQSDNAKDDIVEDDSKKVLVKNLPSNDKEAKTIRSVLTRAGFPNRHLRFQCQPITSNAKKTGDCLLTFESQEDAKKVCHFLNGAVMANHFIEAVIAKGLNIKKQNITVQDNDLKRKQGRDGVVNDEQSANKKAKTEDVILPMPNMKNVTKTVNAKEISKEFFGLQPEYLKKLNIDLEWNSFSNTVVVSNLLPRIDESKVREIFSLAGDVKNIKLLPFINGSNTKEILKKAIIEFDHPLEAVQAISMFNEKPLYNRPMSVQMQSWTPQPLPEGLVCIGRGLGPNGEILRGLRLRELKRQIHEYLVDLRLMNKAKQRHVAPFKFNYKQRYNADVPINTTAIQTSDNSTSTSNGMSNSPRNAAKNDEAQPESTLVAIKSLGTILKSQGIIPMNTECSNLENILNALQNNSAGKSNMAVSVPTNVQGPSMNFGIPSTPGPSMQNDQINALTQSLQQIMQCMSSNNMPQNMQANVAQDFQNFNQMMTTMSQMSVNMQPNMPGPNVNQNAMVGTSPPESIIQKSSVLYDNQPGQSPNMGQFPPNSSYPHNPVFPPAPVYMPTQFNQNMPMYPPIPPVRPPTRANLKELPSQSNMLPQPVVQTVPMMPMKPMVPAPQKANQSPSGEYKRSEMLVFKNLPSSVTKEALSAKMREVGVVLFSEMTGKGRAFVRFKQPGDAERCIRLFHRSKVDGQMIDVSYL